ncbi:MAG: hypothetical protein PF518_12695 [Spirochaetaceae bacterium]|jgi:hypothetical protein|nr:hypothetical protein [Spirochaetaceae bacterium]
MPFSIRMGIPEMEFFWKDLTDRADNNKLNKSDQKLFKKLVKSFNFLSQNPRHPGLSSHEISDLSRRYGMKVWESYLENNTPSAGRIFWVYGPDQNDITIIGIEPHPEDKKRGGYDKVKLSNLE